MNSPNSGFNRSSTRQLSLAGIAYTILQTTTIAKQGEGPKLRRAVSAYKKGTPSLLP